MNLSINMMLVFLGWRLKLTSNTKDSRPRSVAGFELAGWTVIRV
jgi:hypothetical protein